MAKPVDLGRLAQRLAALHRRDGSHQQEGEGG
jgi:hypothetical protein